MSEVHSAITYLHRRDFLLSAMILLLHSSVCQGDRNVKTLTWNPSGDMPLSDRSQPQFSSSPEEQLRVTACATPALEIACTKLASRVPGDTTGCGPTAD